MGKNTNSKTKFKTGIPNFAINRSSANDFMINYGYTINGLRMTGKTVADVPKFSPVEDVQRSFSCSTNKFGTILKMKQRQIIFYDSGWPKTNGKIPLISPQLSLCFSIISTALLTHYQHSTYLECRFSISGSYKWIYLQEIYSKWMAIDFE